jgi:hypothetical protein
VLTRLRILALAATATTAVALAACGGDDSGTTDDDPASLVPADAVVYGQATVRPQGKLKSDVETLASRVSGIDDPAGRLIGLLEESANEEPTASGKQISFERDIDPWLGDEIGVFAKGFSEDPGAAIVQVTDPEAARQFIDDVRQEGDRDATYKGTDYLLDGDDETAASVVGDFLVAGDVPAFEQVVDVSEGDDSLGDQSDFTDALDQAPEGSIADGWASLERIAAEVREEDPSNAQALDASLGDVSGKSVIASVVPSADSLELDFATDADASFQPSDVSGLLESFPADSFAAFGIADLGGIVDRAIDQLESSNIPGFSREAIDEQLSQAGLSLEDVTSALGDLGVFATGNTEASLQGAAVIASKDPEAARNLISKLTAITGLAQLSGASNIRPAPIGKGISITDAAELGRQPLIVTTEGDRIAIGYGEETTRQALSGDGTTLSGDSNYRDAVKALGGDDLSGYVSLPAVFSLAESLGAINDPDYQQAKPYLDSLGYAVIGSGGEGDFKNSKIIVGVQP